MPSLRAELEFATSRNPVSGPPGTHVPGNEDTEAIPERSNHERVFNDRLLLAPGFKREADVELHAGSACHLGHSMALVDDLQHPLDVRLGMQASVERGVAYRGCKLAVR